jgi:hypothetical protein
VHPTGGTEDAARAAADQQSQSNHQHRSTPAERVSAGSRKASPPLVRITPISAMRRVRGRRARRIAVIAVMVVLAAGGGWYGIQFKNGRSSVPAADQTFAVLDGPPVADTFELPVVVNPGDSSNVAPWGVEIVATNDRADAILRLANSGSTVAGTISPMLLGTNGAPWYKVVVGAFPNRSGADYMRAQLRQGGSIEAGGGVVARVPFAFRLDTGLTAGSAKARAAQYASRGIAAYALMTDSDRAAVYAGAFASPEQAVLLLSEFRAAGMKPDLAFRVGRMY